MCFLPVGVTVNINLDGIVDSAVDDNPEPHPLPGYGSMNIVKIRRTKPLKSEFY